MSNILETAVLTEKLIIINGFRHKEVRDLICDVDSKLFLSTFTGKFFETLKYFKPFLDKGEGINHSAIALNLATRGEEITDDTVKQLFEYTEDKKDLKHHIQALKSNKAKLTLIDGDDNLIEKLKEQCNKPYIENKEEIISIYDKIGKQLHKFDTKKSLATRVNVEGYTEVLEHRINSDYKTFGIKEIDERCTYGSVGGLITSIVGRPSHGKSLLSNEIAYKIADSGLILPFDSMGHHKEKPYSTLYLVEMSEASYLDRKISSNTGIPIKAFTQEFKGDKHGIKPRLLKSVKDISENEYFHISDEGTMSYQLLIDDIKRLQDELKQEYMVVTVDLFTKLKEFFGTDLTSSMIAEELGAKLQSDVKSLGIHMIMVAQLGRKGAFAGKLREPSDLENYAPKLEDIKNMGMIEEVSDNVFTVFRPKKIAMENNCDFAEEVDDELVIGCPKQRGGATGWSVHLGFDESTTRLFSLNDNFRQIKDLDSLEVETLMDMGQIKSDSAEL